MESGLRKYIDLKANFRALWDSVFAFAEIKGFQKEYDEYYERFSKFILSTCLKREVVESDYQFIEVRSSGNGSEYIFFQKQYLGYVILNSFDLKNKKLDMVFYLHGKNDPVVIP